MRIGRQSMWLTSAHEGAFGNCYFVTGPQFANRSQIPFPLCASSQLGHFPAADSERSIRVPQAVVPDNEKADVLRTVDFVIFRFSEWSTEGENLRYLH